MLSRGELLYHYPFRYEDRRDFIKGQVVNSRNIYTRTGKTVQKILINTDGGVKELTYFNQPYLVRTLSPGVNLSLSGNDYEINGPQLHTGRLVPIYPQTRGITSKMIRRRVWNLLKQTEKISDRLPESIRKESNLIDLDTALRQIHFPRNEAAAAKAKKRLAFDEMLEFQLQALTAKRSWQEKKSPRLAVNQAKIKQLINSLPFTLTPAQSRVIKEIFADLTSGRPMNRLLYGEVGSGKTVVAAIAMCAAGLNGQRSVLMTPTEILANQHYQTLKVVFAKTPFKIALVTKATKESGDILVGTHALLFKKIDRLGLVVIDEQHRFGVRQRAQLLKVSPRPHLLSMTATPIPRTLALTAYAHLDISFLDQLPFTKPAVKTWLVPETKRRAAYDWIKKQIKDSALQVFIVCPLIEPSEKESMADIKAVTVQFNYLKSVFNKLKLGLIHGRLKSGEKKKVIEGFSKKKLDILVATPVIEVGIDIPQASIMVIENAERFGLAQLHQLRGRIGRRGQKSYCLLFSSRAHKRLKALENLNDGLKLAELDLKLRGPGKVYGLIQHGFISFKLADPFDLKLIALTQKAAAVIMKHASSTKKKNFSSAFRQTPGGD